jgi:hypothetical protein
MLCALTVRQLKPGTFERFAEEFGPQESEGPPTGWVRFDMLRDLADENRVVTFGFFDGTLEELEQSQVNHGYEDRGGRRRRPGGSQWRLRGGARHERRVARVAPERSRTVGCCA